MASLDVKKIVRNKPKVKKFEFIYGDNDIIVNLFEKVIFIDGKIFSYEDCDTEYLSNFLWDLLELDVDLYKDENIIGNMWSIIWYDEYDTYYNEMGNIKYPPNFVEVIGYLKDLK